MDVQAAFHRRFSRHPELLARAPGRVNLLGEHVDYNEGPVLPAAIDRAVTLAAAPQNSRIVTLQALDFHAGVSFHLDALQTKTDLKGRALPSWALYPASVAWALQSAGYPLTGMQAAYSSDIPIGAGLSSSAAVEMAFAVSWQALGGWPASAMDLAQICQHGENDYVGVASGLMDQFASAHGAAGHALFFDTRSLDWEPVPLPAGTAMVIADSGIRRSLTSSAYNERRAACESAVDGLRRFLPDISSLRDVSTIDFAAYSAYLPPVVRKRAEHVVKEIARVGSGFNALQRGDAQSFGAYMFSGHASLRDLYEVSLPELDILVEIAQRLPGILGARLTGAGFGGCTVNLVETAHIEPFIRGLIEGYFQATGRAALVYLCQASDGARVVES